MYSLSIHFGPGPVPAMFLFKDKDKATACFTELLRNIDAATPSTINDDFGQTGYFESACTHAVILENMDLGEESRIQRGLSQARGQARANQRARQDPELLRSMSAQAGPSMITPFGRNGFNG